MRQPFLMDQKERNMPIILMMNFNASKALSNFVSVQGAEAQA